MAQERLSNPPRLRGAALVAICALFLAACGDEDKGTIPPEPAEALLTQLDQIDAAIEAGECDSAQSLAVGFAESVDALPADVDREVKNRLVDAANNLEGQTTTQCESGATGATGDVGETDTTVPPETDTEPPPDEEEPTEPPPDEEEPAEEPPGNSNPGNGNSGGNNGGSSGGVGSG